MKKHVKLDLLPLVVLLLAVLGAFLRRQLYLVGLDEKNLLVEAHPLELALWLCTALASAGICVGSVREKHPGRQLPLLAALGHILAASGILLTVLLDSGSASGPIAGVWKYAGMICAPLMLYAAFSIALGKRPFFGVYAMVSVFFALQLVSHYQSWCADPQLQNYFFAFAGAMALMLFGYYQAAAASGSNDRRGLRVSGLLAVYFCLVAVSSTQYLYLHLGCALWAFSSLCPPKKEGEADGSS